jgi:hypothetical protein
MSAPRIPEIRIERLPNFNVHRESPGRAISKCRTSVRSRERYCFGNREPSRTASVTDSPFSENEGENCARNTQRKEHRLPSSLIGPAKNADSVMRQHGRPRERWPRTHLRRRLRGHARHDGRQQECEERRSCRVSPDQASAPPGSEPYRADTTEPSTRAPRNSSMVAERFSRRV